MAVGQELDKVEPLRHRPRRMMAVSDLLGKRYQQARSLGQVVGIDEDGTVLEVGVVPLDRQVDDGVKQGVTWGDKVRWRHTGHLDLLPLEGDSLVGDEHGSCDPDDAVT